MFICKKKFCLNVKDNIMKDYTSLISKYHQNDIKELINNKDGLKFILKLYYLFNDQSALVFGNIIESIERLGLRHVKIEDNNIYIPYWIQFNYDIKKNELDYIFSIFWIKKNNDLIEKIKQELIKIEDLFISNAIVLIEKNIENSLGENIILSFLTEIKFNIIKDISFENISFENILFIITKANKDCPDFLYQEEEYNDNYKNKINENLYLKKNIYKNNSAEYDLFFENGGVKTDILNENDYSFQCHGIRVRSKQDVEKYIKYLFSNNEIKKAVRNISCYRYKTKENRNIIEGYDDYGEYYTGIRILRILKEMKIYNILIFVSRFKGSLPLEKHTSKYFTITDIFIKDNKYLFDFE